MQLRLFLQKMCHVSLIGQQCGQLTRRRLLSEGVWDNAWEVELWLFWRKGFGHCSLFYWQRRTFRVTPREKKKKKKTAYDSTHDCKVCVVFFFFFCFITFSKCVKGGEHPLSSFILLFAVGSRCLCLAEHLKMCLFSSELSLSFVSLLTQINAGGCRLWREVWQFFFQQIKKKKRKTSWHLVCVHSKYVCMAGTWPTPHLQLFSIL